MVCPFFLPKGYHPESRSLLRVRDLLFVFALWVAASAENITGSRSHYLCAGFTCAPSACGTKKI
jgi:hypothetical protein